MTSNQIAYQSHLENVRHNQTTETETNRHNIAFEQETKRHNVVTETETNRHNVATENWQQSSLAESIRHNRQMENLTGQQIKANYNAAIYSANMNRLNTVTNAQTQVAIQESRVQQQVLDRQLKSLDTIGGVITNGISSAAGLLRAIKAIA